MPVASAIGSIGGALIGANSAKDAARTQTNAADRASLAQQNQAAQVREDQAEWREIGEDALGKLGHLLGTWTLDDYKDLLREEGRFLKGKKEEKGVHTRVKGGRDYYTFSDGTVVSEDENPTGTRMVDAHDEAAVKERALKLMGVSDRGFLTRRFTAQDFRADPVAQLGFQHGLTEGNKFLNQRGAQMGAWDSGQTAKALVRFGNDYGNTKANESYNRFTNDQGNLYGRLAGVGQVGQTATNQVNAYGQQAVNNVGNINMSAANARGAAAITQGNVWGDAVNGIGSAYERSQRPKIGYNGISESNGFALGMDPNAYGNYY